MFTDVSHIPSTDVLASWKEPARLRSFKWALKHFNPMHSASAGMIALVTLEALAISIIGISGGTITTELVTMLTLIAMPIALMASLLPALRAPSEISFINEGIVRECRQRIEFWNYSELRSVTIGRTDFRGESRYLLRFEDEHGDQESILLPWKMDRSRITQILSVTEYQRNS